MRRKLLGTFLTLGMTVLLLLFLGVGAYTSPSAVKDLEAELETIYGTEYTGKEIDNGTEDMVFIVEPKTWFLTNWNLRNALGLDYQYECRVMFTTCIGENAKTIRTITYQAIDPMGKENLTLRAYLKLESRMEETKGA